MSGAVTDEVRLLARPALFWPGGIRHTDDAAKFTAAKGATLMPLQAFCGWPGIGAGGGVTSCSLPWA